MRYRYPAPRLIRRIDIVTSSALIQVHGVDRELDRATLHTGRTGHYPTEKTWRARRVRSEKWGLVRDSGVANRGGGLWANT
jgi:hypothetical protein